MKRTKTSKAWMHEHVTDPFVKAAKREGYRSRAAYKLMEIDEHYQLFRPGMTVVDLGATPGGWSQVARQQMGTNGRVIALDILPLEPISGVEFLLGDFTTEETNQKLIELLNAIKADIVISDMAPNISGIVISDQAKSIYLAELALDFAQSYLKPGGNFIVKLFHGGGFEEFVKKSRQDFEKIVVKKPEAARDRSKEVYLLGLKKKQRD